MDAIDRKLVMLLSQNARYSVSFLAQQVYLSAPAVSARIAHLEQAGVISGYTVELNAEKLGYAITAFIHLDVPPKRKAEFYPFIERCDCVMECCCVTGEYSMLIKVAFESTTQLDAFIGQLQEFGRTSTQIVFSTPVAHRPMRVEQLPVLEKGARKVHLG